MEIAQGLAHDPMMVVEQKQDICCGIWNEGFMKAVSLNQKEWLRLSERGPEGHLMPPTLLHLIYNHLGAHAH